MSLVRRLAPALCLLAFAIASPALGQPAHLLRDIAAGRERFGGDAHVNSLTPFGPKVAFLASDERMGTEVWVTDSESHRTYPLGDICRGYCNDAPAIVGALGSTLFFIEARSHGAERLLWASDGTARGTHPVLDGAEVLAYALLPDRLVFLAGSPLKLWRVDGTASAVTEIASVTDPVQTIEGFTVSGNRAFLSLRYSSTLRLWVTDGTAAGTRKLAELLVNNPAPEIQAATATHVFFIIASGSTGQELWASDGTAAGTRAVSSFAAFEPFGITHWLKPIGKFVYFLADDISHGHELWRSDGTPLGTTRVSEFGYAFPFEDIYDDEVEELAGKVVFFATDGFGPLQLWTSTGEPSSTRQLSGVCDDPCYLADEPWLRRLGNRLFFPVSYGELWFTDGTAAGTGPLISACPNACVSQTSAPLLLGGRLYFLASGPSSDRELWSSDGTRAGTHEATSFEDWDAFEDYGPPYVTPEVVAAGGRLWFAAAQHPYGLELWSTTGAPETTELAADIARGAASSDPTTFATLGERVLFTAALCDDGRRDVWASDGVSTQRASGFVTECYYGLDGEQPIVVSGPYGYFWQDTYDPVLWRTDGTAGGTILLGSFPDTDFAPLLLPVDGGIAFVIEDGLWRSDGTVAGTVKKVNLPGYVDAAFADGRGVYLIAGEPSAPSRQVWRADLGSGAVVPLTTFGGDDTLGIFQPPLFTSLGSQVYFWLAVSGHRLALWRTDGTPGGTALLFELPNEAGNEVPAMKSAGGALYFYTRVHVSSDTYQLWRSDGSAQAPTRLHTFSIRPGIDLLPTFELAALDDEVLFVGDDPAHGRELWSTDGTPEGTRLLSDVLAGLGSSSPSELTAAAGRVFFTAGDPVHGRELWQSDGTAAGTRLVHDVAPEALSSEPAHLTVAGSNLFFAADDGLSGNEPWVLPLAGPTACVASDTVLCLGAGRFRVEAVWRDFAGNTGTAHAAPRTADTGTFWFFSPSNVEVILKVLDGRGVNDHQWVFYGALSSVEYTLTVTDTQTGAVRRYFNPVGRLASIGDTEAFGPRGAAALRRQSRAPAASPPPLIAERRDDAAKSECVASATRLCLADGRFAVEVAWRDFAGNSGVGSGTPLSTDTGDFWFFSADNVELVVKVLDGRPVNGKFWLFYGALSSVEYTLTVTDTATGTVRTYTNPSGRLASFADTAAF